MKSFLIFACATILAPNSKQEVHFLLHGQMSKSRGAWLPKYTPMAIMPCPGYTGSKPSAHNDGRPYEAGSSHSDDPTETIEARLSRNSEHLMSLASSVAQDIATLRARSNGGQSGCALTPPEEAVNVERRKTREAPQTSSPTPRRRFKHTAKRLVKPAAICKSPSSLNVFNYFLKSANKKGWLRIMRCEDGEPSEILCDMHGTYITRDELSSLNGGRWVNSVIIGVVCRMMNVES
ncbi:hypothetical protein CK203_056341 [Vitis vinifera]|uniref:Uncharacterized protein n=1 Tax=Vitis vinifera TaxID=29760 RepID=A0A438GNX7_VITVI|nr:hypothetical protein CK203_056341 [Vitis vinifera]